MAGDSGLRPERSQKWKFAQEILGGWIIMFWPKKYADLSKISGRLRFTRLRNHFVQNRDVINYQMQKMKRLCRISSVVDTWF